MQAGGAEFELREQGDRLVLVAGGQWLVASAAELDEKLRQLGGIAAGARLSIDLGEVDQLDTAGAWLLLRTSRALEAQGVTISLDNVPPAFRPLLDQVARVEPVQPGTPRRRSLVGTVQSVLARLGERAVEAGLAAVDLCGFFGLVIITLGRSLRHPSRLRYVALVAQVERTGVTALPIIGLLCFLIGVVIAFQSADQLRIYFSGAELYTVNLLGVGILRELGVLITAIVVAGRSGSAFTAEIGAMEVREEIDAMRTLALDPIELLVLPRLLGLVIALPMLVVFADFMGLLGGAFMTGTALAMPLPLFMRQLHDAIGAWTFWVGIIKAPFFAGTIALVGCHAGFNVARSAESVGRLTTLSVVRSIFLVIIIDAAFSILFSRIGI
jgi:phospholipid/cholesterol/gamma-HCH transport system permease protein